MERNGAKYDMKDDTFDDDYEDVQGIFYYLFFLEHCSHILPIFICFGVDTG